jgi:hypothetical protein
VTEILPDEPIYNTPAPGRYSTEEHLEAQVGGLSDAEKAKAEADAENSSKRVDTGGGPSNVNLTGDDQPETDDQPPAPEHSYQD